MASYTIEWRRSTKKDLRKIPPSEVRKIIDQVGLLGENPYPPGTTKLSGSENAFRIRVGDYRILYEVFEEVLIVEVIRVAHRKDVYRR